MADFTPAPVKPIAAIAALEALDIRVGTIGRVEDVPRSEKLVKLTVNFGDHSRTILAGLKKQRENPREIADAKRPSWQMCSRARWLATFPQAYILISAPAA